VASPAIAAELRLQRVAFLEADEARRARLQAIAFPILKAAVELFPNDQRPTIGIATFDEETLAPPYRETGRELYGLGPLPMIRAVVPGSPAEQAGLAVGDEIIAVGGEELSDARKPLEVLRKQLVVEEPVPFRLRREGTEITRTVRPAALAPYRIQLVYDPSINARATGQTIELNLGMLQFCENDAELAFVFAHELAHNALRHQRETILNYLMGTAVDVALLAAAIPSANTVGLTAAYYRSPAFELEADYVALYLLARAGYPLDPIRDFWRRVALLGPERKSDYRLTFWTHPDPSERHVRLNAAIDEVQARLASGLPLTPKAR
jgi:Zn-dependent protease with chaperone function